MARVVLPSGTPAELVRPSGGPAPAGLVLAADLMGLRPLYDDLCGRLAAENHWAVCAPEPFPGREYLSFEQRQIGSNDDDRVLADLLAAADLLAVEPLSVLGFCQGGMWALKASGTGRFSRAVSFYGHIRVDWARPGHAQPLEWVDRPGACPVLAIVAGRDALVPVSDADLLRTRPQVEVVVYPDAEHGFVHDPARPTHRRDDAADAWRRAIAFLSAA
ncbi:MAG: dienelactone hydrolase family protein [Acidimicrobiales bacterium]